MRPQQDPNVAPGALVIQQVKTIRRQRQLTQMAASCAVAVVLAPLKTVAVLLQLSVKPHANLYGTQEQHKTALSKQNTQLTARDKARYELLLRKGGDPSQKIFQAPVYGSFKDVLTDLSSQGFKAYFKGLQFRLLHLLVGSTARLFIGNEIIMFGQNEATWAAKLAFYTAIDVATNVLAVGEHRFILQNNLPNFRTYKSPRFFLSNYFARVYSQAWRSSLVLAPLHALTLSFTEDTFYPLVFLASWLLCQPLLTATRRVQCQSDNPGMIALRYSGVVHCLRLVIQEEGVRGLYRGALLEGVYRTAGVAASLAAAQYYNCLIVQQQ